MLAPVPTRPITAALSLAAAVMVAACGCSLLAADPSSTKSPSSATSSPSPSSGASASAGPDVAGEDLPAALGVGNWGIGVVGLDVDAPEPPAGWSAGDVEDLLERDTGQYVTAYLRADLWSAPYEQAREKYLAGLGPFYGQFAAQDAPSDLAQRQREFTNFAPGVVARFPYVSATSAARVDEVGRLWVDLATVVVQPASLDGKSGVVVGRRTVSFAKDRSAPADDPTARYWAEASFRLLAVDCASFEVAAVVPLTRAYQPGEVEQVRAYIAARGYPEPGSPGAEGNLGGEQCASAPSADV